MNFIANLGTAIYCIAYLAIPIYCFGDLLFLTHFIASSDAIFFNVFTVVAVVVFVVTASK